MSTPSIALNDDVIVRGQLISKEKLEEEVAKRIEKWRLEGFSLNRLKQQKAYPLIELFLFERKCLVGN
jgi:hypothetical protein